jgi:CRP-like cAMP-binding protein
MARRRSASVPGTNRPPPSAPSRPAPSSVSNRLLAALPAVDRDRLLPTLDVVPLKLKDLLHKAGERLQYVYFPGGGFLSIVTVLQDGRMVEVATVGREGAVGVTTTADHTPMTSATMVQGEFDICYRMAAETFRREMDKRGAFYELLSRYAQAHIGVVMQATACNAVHTVEQRLARWLLMAHDRMATDEFPLTQEFVAMMLGATRPTVSVVAGLLQKAGLITYHHGRVAIMDRAKLESASCECYAAATTLLSAVTTQ